MSHAIIPVNLSKIISMHFCGQAAIVLYFLSNGSSIGIFQLAKIIPSIPMSHQAIGTDNLMAMLQ